MSLSRITGRLTHVRTERIFYTTLAVYATVIVVDEAGVKYDIPVSWPLTELQPIVQEEEQP